MPIIPAHFFPEGFSSSESKISLRRSTCPRVCSKCCSIPERSSSELAALVIFGSAFTKRFSASYKSLSSSMYKSFSALCSIFPLPYSRLGGAIGKLRSCGLVRPYPNPCRGLVRALRFERLFLLGSAPKRNGYKARWFALGHPLYGDDIETDLG